MRCSIGRLKVFNETRCRSWNCSLWWKRGKSWHTKLFLSLVTSNRLWLQKYHRNGVSSLFFFVGILKIFFLHQIASNNSIQLAFECVTYSFIRAKLVQSLSVQWAYHIRKFHSTAHSESKCQIHYQFSCFALLSWAIATWATRLKFIVMKFMTWECSCPGIKMVW